MTDQPEFTGRCYCGALAYSAKGAPLYKAQCHCRTCMYYSGGSPSLIMLMPKDGFRWTRGTPASFARDDLEIAATWSFCPTCGTLLSTALPNRDYLVIRVGTLDDPAAFGGPHAAVRTKDAPSFHTYPEGIPRYDDVPPR